MLAQLALVEIEGEAWSEAMPYVEQLREILSEYELRRATTAGAWATRSRRSGPRGRVRATRRSTRGSRLGSSSPYSRGSSRGWRWRREVLARVSLLLGDVATARLLVREAESLLARSPGWDVLEARLDEVRQAASETTSIAGLAATPLTTAELRVLRYLPTHLSLAAIADELFVSRNTVKTHTIAIYRKLGVSSRPSTVARARELGLLEE